MIFFLQCPLPSLLSKCGLYVSETGTTLFGAGEEETRSQSFEEGTCSDFWAVGILIGGKVEVENSVGFKECKERGRKTLQKKSKL